MDTLKRVSGVIVILTWQVFFFTHFLNAAPFHGADSIPWESMSLTQETMKILPSYQLKNKKGSNTLWYLLGGAATGGLTAAIITSQNKNSSSIFTLREDEFTISCEESHLLDVLQNDEGTDLQLVSVSDEFQRSSISGSQILFTPNGLLAEEYMLRYQVRNNNGEVKETTVQLHINYPPLIVHDDQFYIKENESISNNILANDQGESMMVVQHSQVAKGVLAIDPNGDMRYQSEESFTGQLSFTYLVEDRCGQQAEAMVTIDITNQECIFDLQSDIRSSDCGLASGSIRLEVEPEGEYFFLWESGDSTASLTKLSAGTYKVTVSDTSSCKKSYSFIVSENEPEYNLQYETEDASCIGGGEISLYAESQGEGAIVCEVYHNTETTTFDFEAEQWVQLSDYREVYPGTYLIVIYDKQQGQACKDSFELEINYEPDSIHAASDSFQIGVGQLLTENLLTNDTGIALKLVSVSQPSHGMIHYEENGIVQYMADDEFVGEVELIYLIKDTCEQQDSGLVYINIEDNCTISFELTVDSADCGLSNGGAQIELFSSGKFDFLWSNGVMDSIVQDIPSGSIDVQIRRGDGSCDTTLHLTIPEKQASYILDTSILQGDCMQAGDIRMQLSPSFQGGYEVWTTHPQGIERFEIQQGGWISLADYISIQAGEYIIEVRLLEGDDRCVHEIHLSLQEVDPLVLMIIDLVPPSSPTASDGEVYLELSTQTIPPYFVYVNGELELVTTDLSIPILNLSAGFYQIEVKDDRGCSSNVVEIELFPDVTLSFQLTSATSLFQDPGVEHPIAPVSGNIITANVSFSSPFSPFLSIQYLPSSAEPTLSSYPIGIVGGLQSKIELNKMAIIARFGYQNESAINRLTSSGLTTFLPITQIEGNTCIGENWIILTAIQFSPSMSDTYQYRIGLCKEFHLKN